MGVGDKSDPQWSQWDQYRFPELFARNLTRKVISCNVGRIKWEVPPSPRLGFETFLPWEVAISDGFLRAWERGELLVALDDEFIHVISELPLGEGGVSVFRPKVFRQTTPQSTTTIYHGLNRDGPVLVSAYSLDHLVQWEGFVVDIVDSNTCRISFDSPTTFEATIY